MSDTHTSSRGAFEAQLGKVFQPKGADVALELVKVEKLPQGFVLLFQGPYKRILEEGLYEFAVESGESFTFHVMPIHTPLPGHQDYQAIFN